MGLIEALAPLLGLALVFWILLGGPTRSRERKEERRRRGGRIARDRGFWGAPARDRQYEPGALLLVFVVVTLAETVLDAAADGSGALSAALILGAVISIAFRYRPDLVSVGMGVVGIVVLVLERLGARGCGEAVTALQNAVWLFGAAVMLSGAALFGTVLTPVRAATQSVSRVSRSFLMSAGQPRPFGALGHTALVAFGVLNLLDLLLRPAGMEQLGGSARSTPVLLAAIVATVAVICVGLAVIPQFTSSVIGIGVALGNLFLLTAGDPCRDLTLLVVIGVCFYAVSVLARRLS